MGSDQSRRQRELTKSKKKNTDQKGQWKTKETKIKGSCGQKYWCAFERRLIGYAS